MYYSQALLLFEVNLYLVWMPSPHESCMPVRQNVSNNRPHWLVLYKLKTTTKHTYNVFVLNSLNLIAMHESIYILYSLCQLSMCNVIYILVATQLFKPHDSLGMLQLMLAMLGKLATTNQKIFSWTRTVP